MNKRRLNGIGLFIIALVMSIPFCVADVYAASISITANHGDKKFKGFIDGAGDTWVVESLISGAINGTNGTIDPKQVKINVKGREDSFNSCSGGALGTTCKYVSPLKDGITSGVYDFSVFYYFLDSLGNNQSVSASDKIKVDGTKLSDGFTDALQIKLKSVKQNSASQGLILDFTVEDKDKAYCSGIKKIEIIDSVAGVLKTIQNFSAGDCDYDYRLDTASSGYLSLNLTGEGKRWIKIRAEDNLGHTYTTGATSFYSDFVKPVIDKNSLKLKDFGTYIGQFKDTTDISLNVTEKSNLKKVTATSSQAKIEGSQASCIQDSKVVGAWTCTWNNIEVIPASTISLIVTAEDEMGNQVNQTISTSLNVDKSNPIATYFGTARTYQKVSYVSGKKGIMNQLVLKISEKGAGIDKNDLLASLAGLDGQNDKLPDFFNNTTLVANWNIDYGGGSPKVLVGLSKFQDKVGNYDSKLIPKIHVNVDSSGPIIESMEVYGTSSTATKKNYLQSADKLNLEFKINEGNGLLLLVDLNEIVKDAKTKYPDSKVKEKFPEADISGYADRMDYSGWAVFTEQDCNAGKKYWECKLETSSIKSGPDPAAALEIEVYDTAGNPATWKREPKNVKSGSKGSYKVNILGVANEANPDYWEVASVSTYGIGDFIDIDATQQISSRIAMQIALKTDSRAEAGKIDLVGCTPESGFSAKAREILFDNLGGTTSATPTPLLIVEMSPFDSRSYLKIGQDKDYFETAYVNYTCKFNIYSKLGSTALQNAEVQEVGVPIPFAFTSYGSLDENLKKKIDDAKAEYYDHTEWIGVVKKVLDWVRYVGRIVNVIQGLIGIYDLVSSTVNTAASELEGKGPLAVAANVLKGTCFTVQTSEDGVLKYVKYLQIPIQILSCEPGGAAIDAVDPITGKKTGKKYTSSGLESALGENNWYFAYQRYILDGYNTITARKYLGIPATSLYDNFYLSIIGLCIPGVIYNLEKLREVHCRKIVCLQKEVPQGIATVQSCDNLFELMECQYFTGPFLEILPSGLWNTLGDALKGAFSSPVGLVAGLTELVACAAGCWVQHGSSVMLPCKAVKFINQILDIVNTVVGLVKNRPDVTGAPYCDMVEDLDKAKDKKTTTAPVKSTTGTTGAKVVSTTGGTSGSTGRTPTSGTAPTTSKSVPLTSSTATTGGTTK